jgi:glycosyltransferase involved in cell wall biosynthesis
LISDRTPLLGDKPIIPQICDGPGEPGLVSVVIPTYNRGYIVGAAIESVLAQTYRQFEIIVVDDGSRDGTRAVVESFDFAIRYVYQENAGREFIAFLDSDDEWFPWKLQVQCALMRRFPEIALVWTDMTTTGPDATAAREKHLESMYHAYRKIDKDEFLPNTGRIKDICPDCPAEIGEAAFRYGDIFTPMFLGNLVHPPTVLLRRSHLARSGGLDLTFSWTCEDYEFFWRVSREGLGAFVETSGALYRVNAGDQLSRPDLLVYVARGNLIALKSYLARERDRIKLPPRVIRRQMADAYAWLAEEELRCGADNGTAGHVWKSLCLNPLKARVLALLVLSLIPRFLFNLARSLNRRLGRITAFVTAHRAHVIVLMVIQTFDLLTCWQDIRDLAS